MKLKQAEIDDRCRQIYVDARLFWESINFCPPLGFKILNGPPIRHAEILFVGYQPGGDEKAAEEEIKKETDKRWPILCEYAVESWPLAPKMRTVFSTERLKNCVGTNIIFLRYPNDLTYRRDIGNRRKDIENFCAGKVQTIIQAIQPKSIVTIGFRALEMFGPAKPLLRRRDGERVLLKAGSIAGHPAIGMLHLTGARPSKADLLQLKEWFSS
jgi:hypothetical protein